jgi:hypothetical protein
LDRLVVLLRHEQLYNNTVRTEIYNMDWRRPKTVDDASRLDHGQVLYVEEADPKAKITDFKWDQEFAKDRERLTLNLNDPVIDPDANVFSVKIEVRKDNTLMELKQKIAEIFNI